jgi:hypothetical protein
MDGQTSLLALFMLFVSYGAVLFAAYALVRSCLAQVGTPRRIDWANRSSIAAGIAFVLHWGVVVMALLHQDSRWSDPVGEMFSLALVYLGLTAWWRVSNDRALPTSASARQAADV